MTVDLTNIREPFGLLDEVYGSGTKAALQTHGGPWEVFLDGKWRAKSTFTWQPAYTYRVKPQTVKPREWWVAPNHYHPEGFSVVSSAYPKAIRVREVLP